MSCCRKYTRCTPENGVSAAALKKHCGVLLSAVGGDLWGIHCDSVPRPTVSLKTMHADSEHSRNRSALLTWLKLKYIVCSRFIVAWRVLPLPAAFHRCLVTSHHPKTCILGLFENVECRVCVSVLWSAGNLFRVESSLFPSDHCDWLSLQNQELAVISVEINLIN